MVIFFVSILKAAVVFLYLSNVLVAGFALYVDVLFFIIFGYLVLQCGFVKVFKVHVVIEGASTFFFFFFFIPLFFS